MRSLLFSLACLLPAAAAANPVAIGVHVDVDVVEQPAHGPFIVAAPLPPPPPPRLFDRRWEVGLDLGAGVTRLGVVSVDTSELHAVIARQLGPLRLGLEGSFGGFSGARDFDLPSNYDALERFDGQAWSVGVTARLRLAGERRCGWAAACSVGPYVELGVGRQQLAWTSTGALRTYGMSPDVFADWSGEGSIARPIGSAGIGVEALRGGGFLGGLDLGVRFTAAPALDLDKACAGSCAQLAPGRAHDLGVIAHLGVTLGS